MSKLFRISQLGRERRAIEAKIKYVWVSFVEAQLVSNTDWDHNDPSHVVFDFASHVVICKCFHFHS
jgi:hypothetical protein